MTGPVLLFGMDGGTFDVLDPLMEQGVMPYLRNLVAGGTRAPLRTIVPALTPPGWASLMTGKRPGQHGVFDFFRREKPDSQYFRFATSQDVGTATLWSLANDSGCRSIVLNFPSMFPPPAIDGAVVPGGWMPWRQLRLGCYPPGLFDRLKSLPSFEARELALDMTLEEKALEGCAPEEYADWIALHVRRERRWLDVLRYLVREEPARLVAVLFDGVDKLQHLCWRFIRPDAEPASEWEANIRRLCLDYFRHLDSVLAEAVEIVGQDTRVLIASDHGAGPSTDIFFVNTWLEQEGYLAWSSDANAAEQTTGQARLGVNQMARHVYQLDWTRTVAYAPSPSANGIFFVGRGPDTPEGLSPEQCAALRLEISAKLRRVRHPATNEPVVTHVWTRDEVFSGEFEDFAPDLTLELADGGFVSILRSSDIVQARPEVVGVHRPMGIFVAAGPGIKSGATLEELAITDITPLALHGLGLGIPEDLDRRSVEAVFEDASWSSRPRPVSRARAAAPAATLDVTLDAESEAIMLKRLQALGYVE